MTRFKYFLPALLSVVLLASCAKTLPKTGEKDSTAVATTTKYTCPMHPEITQDGPGKCPKCGMDLVPKEAPLGVSKIKMDYSTLPAAPDPGKSTLLKLQPKFIDGGTVQDLAIVHEMPMHLMVMSKDLKTFEHVHPERKSDGSFLLPYTFPASGSYVLWSEIEEKGESMPEHFRLEQQVGANTTPSAQLSPSSGFSADGYTFSLTTGGNVVAGKSANLSVHIEKNGKLVTNLENYLGALGHMSIVSEDTKLFLHAHPQEDSHPAGETTAPHPHGPDVSFMTLFTVPGKYKLWAQFNIDGKIRTAEFVVNVSSAS